MEHAPGLGASLFALHAALAMRKKAMMEEKQYEQALADLLDQMRRDGEDFVSAAMLAATGEVNGSKLVRQVIERAAGGWRSSTLFGYMRGEAPFEHVHARQQTEHKRVSDVHTREHDVRAAAIVRAGCGYVKSKVALVGGAATSGERLADGRVCGTGEHRGG
ncbi:hypothetical protein AB1Y20_023614 [Prymnesium parvum]|uniref:Uncharacterized protein n=1 Tax=Prymnesium parvum TaxID=97485 RepID=A0AB34JFW4_PRYPA